MGRALTKDEHAYVAGMANLHEVMRVVERVAVGASRVEEALEGTDA